MNCSWPDESRTMTWVITCTQVNHWSARFCVLCTLQVTWNLIQLSLHSISPENSEYNVWWQVTEWMCGKGREGRVQVCAVMSSRRQFKSRWWWLRVHLHAPGGPDWDLQWAPQETPCLGNNRSQGVFILVKWKDYRTYLRNVQQLTSCSDYMDSDYNFHQWCAKTKFFKLTWCFTPLTLLLPFYFMLTEKCFLSIL